MPPGPPRPRCGRASSSPRSLRTPDHSEAPPDHSGSSGASSGEAPNGRRDVPAGRLEALLADLGPSLRRGTALPSAALPSAKTGAITPFRACGLPAIDRLIGGGFPADRLSEVTGPVSSGRTSIALALLARTTVSEGELAAVVDLADAFDPVSAESAGVNLDRILWVRAGGLREALRSVERLLETEGIPVVILDSSEPSPAAARTLTPRTRHTRRPGRLEATIPASAWTRLARSATRTRTTLVALSDRRLTGTQADLVLEMRPAEPRFTGTPPLFERIGLRAVLVRRRGGPVSGEVAGEELSEGSLRERTLDERSTELLIGSR